MQPPPQKRKASVSLFSDAKRGPSGSVDTNSRYVVSRNHVKSSSQGLVVRKNEVACLDGLPEEMIAKVFGQLGSGLLAVLSRTSKKFKRIADAVLYRGDPRFRAGIGRTKAIATNVTLGKSVRYLNLAYKGFDREAARLNREAARARHYFSRALENASNLQELRILEEMDMGFDRDDLSIFLGWLQVFDNVAIASMQGLHVRQPFAQLKRLKVDTQHVSLEEMSSVFLIPSLEQLTLVGVYQTAPFANWTVPSASCNVRKLTLDSAFTDVNAVSELLSSMKNLVMFDYRWDSINNYLALSNQIHPRANWAAHSWALLGDALRKLKHSLEEISIYFNTDPEIVDMMHLNGLDLHTLGSFQDFPKLHTVSIPIDAMLDLKAGETDFSRYLPHLNSFSTEIKGNDNWILQCCSDALESLQNVIRAGPDNVLILRIDPEVLLWRTKLSRALEKLEKASIELALVARHGSCQLSDIKDMEVSDYNTSMGGLHETRGQQDDGDDEMFEVEGGPEEENGDESEGVDHHDGQYYHRAVLPVVDIPFGQGHYLNMVTTAHVTERAPAILQDGHEEDSDTELDENNDNTDISLKLNLERFIDIVRLAGLGFTGP